MTTVLNHPRTDKDFIWIATLSISSLRLHRDQRFRGYSVLSFDPWDATSIESLSDAEYEAFFQDLRTVSRALRAAMHPDHMNYELLGNSVPHLHWHIAPRYKTDPRWGQPIWEQWQPNEFQVNRHTVSDAEYEHIISLIQAELGKL